ncbi:hypothetical protein FCM35_KLT15787 [Carex littledalei]|uniref:Uncharacterized protein n=1 Tax=Carex littledalei TaxID=544730 RepID=A0A833VJ47_9POAL|nr:hypothetical protein FCM35_KLT15787 [Carex littledalei]
MAIREKSLAEAAALLERKIDKLQRFGKKLYSSWIASTRGFQVRLIASYQFMDGGELLAEGAAASNSHLKDEFVRTLTS